MSEAKNEPQQQQLYTPGSAIELQFLRALEAACVASSLPFVEPRQQQTTSLSSSMANFADALGTNSFLSDLFGCSTASPSFAQQNQQMLTAANSSIAPLSGGGTGPTTLARNSTKTLKCPKCNWHYKYQETLEIHMKEKHADVDVVCVYCVEGRLHPKLARGETYSCGYKPYRCDLCKYSTTTKGNLSIHMQSDKHLHALQEIPQSIPGSLSMLFNGESSSGGGVSDVHYPATKNAKLRSLQCLICLKFSADSFAEMTEHINHDRQTPGSTDISVIHGIFQCLLCPYSTNLKANFQLHTRTDKHIQRVQLINHMREGSAALGLGELAPLSRLSTLKSTVHVRCQPCQEIFSCSLSLREHCESQAHIEQIARSSDANAQLLSAESFGIHNLVSSVFNEKDTTEQKIEGGGWIRDIFSCIFVRCKFCEFEARTLDTEIEHHWCVGSLTNGGEQIQHIKEENETKERTVATEHPESSSPTEEADPWFELNAFFLESGEALDMQTAMLPHSTAQTSSSTCNGIAFDPSADEIGSEGVPNNSTAATTTETTINDEGKEGLFQHCSDDNDDENRQCPLCPRRFSQHLKSHLLEEHKIPCEMVERVLSVVVASSSSQQTANKETVADENRTNGIVEDVTTIAVANTTNPAQTKNAVFLSSPQKTMLESAIYRHRCSSCAIAFRSAAQLRAHSLSHTKSSSLKPVYRCPHEECFSVLQSLGALRRHVEHAHPVKSASSSFENQRGHQCDICDCNEHFANDTALFAHLNSAEHLQKAFQQVTDGALHHLHNNNNNSIINFGAGDKANNENPFKNQFISLLGKSPFGQQLASQPLPHAAVWTTSDSSSSASSTNKRQNPSTTRDALKSSLKTSTTSSLSDDDDKLSKNNQNSDGNEMNSLGKVAAETNSLFTNIITENGHANLFEQMFKPSSSSSHNLAQAQHAFALINQMLQQSASPAAASYFHVLPFAVATNAALMAQFAAEFGRGTPSDFESGGFGSNNNNASSLKTALSLDDDNNNSDLLASIVSQQQQQHSTTTTSDNNCEPPKVKRARRESASAAAARCASRDSSITNNQQNCQLADSAASSMDHVFNWMQMMMAANGGGSTLPFLASSAAGMNNNQNGTTTALNLQSMSEQFSSAINQMTKGNQGAVSMLADGAKTPSSQLQLLNNDIAPPKRARTRINDEQLAILRQYFDIDNLPNEDQIKEMVKKADLPERERQRNLNSPYNFSIPPQMGIDLAIYQRTGEAKIIPAKVEDSQSVGEMQDEASPTCSSEPSEHQRPNTSSNIVAAVANDGQKSGISSPKVDLQTTTHNTKSALETTIASKKSSSSIIETSSSPSPKSTTSILPKAEPNDSENSSLIQDNVRSPVQQQQQIKINSTNELLSNLNKAINQQQSNNQLLQQHQQQNPFSALFNAIGVNSSSTASDLGTNQHHLASIFANSGFSGFFPFMPTMPTPRISCSPQHIPSSPQHITYGQHFSTPPPGSSNMVGSGSSTLSNSLITSAIGSGRRANRTRFTDSQLKRLQNFFDKQAYPKDEDVEYLSNTLKLSPRVIVVWFQNARQKARKIYENQPNLAAPSSGGSGPKQCGGSSFDGGRVGRTTGGGFQCKRCEQAFQRYFELIHHQQQNCYKNDAEAQHSDNKSMEENLSEEERANSSNASYTEDKRTQPSSEISSVANIVNATNPFHSLFASTKTEVHEQQEGTGSSGTAFGVADPHELFKQLIGAHPFSSLSTNRAEKQHDIDTKFSINQDLASSTSSEFMMSYESLNGLDTANVPLDLSKCGSEAMSKHQQAVEDAHRLFNMHHMPQASSVSPAAYSYSAEENDDDGGSQSPFSQQIDGPRSYKSEPQYRQHSPLLGQPGASKRFRTHLTPMQVYIMKSLFNVYKTPSMTECDDLGKKIGLQRRVVQVWFQNARAKERKATGDEIASSVHSTTNFSCASGADSTCCELCDVQFDSRTTSQQHIFTDTHIEQIKLHGCRSGVGPGVADDASNLSEMRTKSAGSIPIRSSSADFRSAATFSESSPSAICAAVPFVPYNLMLNAAAAATSGGLPAATIPPFLYDSLVGTSVHSLTIPSEVMQQIANDIHAGKEFTKFTQDGLKLTELKSKISADNFQKAEALDSEVGWACTRCSNVFQQLEFLHSHQRLICAGCKGVFRLIQTHYNCQVCSIKFGTQDEFRSHCELEEHKKMFAECRAD